MNSRDASGAEPPTEATPGPDDPDRLPATAWWKRPAVSIPALVGVLILFLAMVDRLMQEDAPTSESTREAAIQRQMDGFGMTRDEVVGTADAFCEAVRASDTYEDYEATVGAAWEDEGLGFLFGDASETMVRIGGCEDDYLAIGGLLGDAREEAEREEAAAEAEANPSTPVPVMGDGGPAVLELANGERFEFDAVCSLTHEHAPGLSIRYGVFADDGTIRLEALAMPFEEQYPGVDPGEWFSISVFDSESYEELWGASSITSSDLVFDVDGSQVTATGTFYERGFDGKLDGGPSVAGTLTARC